MPGRISWLSRAVCAAVVCVCVVPQAFGFIRECYVMPDHYSEVRTSYTNGFEYTAAASSTRDHAGLSGLPPFPPVGDGYVYLSYEYSSNTGTAFPDGSRFTQVSRELYVDEGLSPHSWDHDSLDIVWNYDQSDFTAGGVSLDLYQGFVWGQVVDWTSFGAPRDSQGRPLKNSNYYMNQPLATITIRPSVGGDPWGDPGGDPWGDPGGDPGNSDPVYDLEIAYPNGFTDITSGLPAFGRQVTTVDLTQVAPGIMTGSRYLGLVAASNGWGGGVYGNSMETAGIIAIDAIRGGELAGRNQTQPLLPSEIGGGRFAFDDAPSGGWLDPPYTSQFEYSFAEHEDADTVFEKIIFPDGFEATFEVWVDGLRLASDLGPGDEFIFAPDVRAFTITGIDPLGPDGTVDAALGDAFPLWVSFSKDYADVVMNVPEPATLGLLAFGGLALIRRRRAA